FPCSAGDVRGRGARRCGSTLLRDDRRREHSRREQGDVRGPERVHLGARSEDGRKATDSALGSNSRVDAVSAVSSFAAVSRLTQVCIRRLVKAASPRAPAPHTNHRKRTTTMNTTALKWIGQSFAALAGAALLS